MKRSPATLEHAIHEMVHHGEHEIDELADLLSWSESSLYRAANPYDEGANFPAKKLIPAMRAQNNFAPLFHLNQRLGFVAFPIPKRVGCMQPDELAELQTAQAAAVHAMYKFLSGEINQDEAREAIDNAIAKLARARKAVDHGIKQGELTL